MGPLLRILFAVLVGLLAFWIASTLGVAHMPAVVLALIFGIVAYMYPPFPYS